MLSYCLVTPYGDIGLDQHWLRQWTACHIATGHYVNQCWLIISELPGIHLRTILQKMLKLYILYMCSSSIATASLRRQWVTHVFILALSYCIQTCVILNSYRDIMRLDYVEIEGTDIDMDMRVSFFLDFSLNQLAHWPLGYVVVIWKNNFQTHLSN